MRLVAIVFTAGLLARPAAASEVGCPARVVVPDTTATFYDASSTNACNLPVAPGEFVAAITELDWNGSQACGRCARVTGPLGQVVVRITDQCPADAFNPLCQVAGHLDLSRAAFLEIANEVDGLVDVSWESIACDVEGPVAFYFDPTSNPYFVRLSIRNHRYGIAGVEIRWPGRDWTALPRTDYNAFQLVVGSPVSSPVDLRVTDVHGAVLESTGVPYSSGVEHAASGQFQACPEPGAWIAGLSALGALAWRRGARRRQPGLAPRTRSSSTAP